MTLPDKKPELLTYADYFAWPGDERWEIIGGTACSMVPAPSNRHQKITWELVRQIRGFLADKPCEGRTAPFDVRFPEGVKENDKSLHLRKGILEVSVLRGLEIDLGAVFEKIRRPLIRYSRLGIRLG